MTESEKRNYEERFKPAYDAWIVHYPLTVDDLPGEVWKTIPNWEKYQGSNYGRVKSWQYGKPKILKPILELNGYLIVVLSDKGRHKRFRVHRLIGELFVANPRGLTKVSFRDNCKLNCCADNLFWCTGSDLFGRVLARRGGGAGEKNFSAKFTNEQVRYIRQNPEKLSAKALAEQFGVGAVTISNIQRGLTYKDAGGTIRKKKRLTPEDKELIRARYNHAIKSQRMPALAREFGFNISTISRVISGK